MDDYISALLIPPDPALDAAIQSTIDRNLQPIDVAPNQGKLLHIQALTRGAHTILDLNVQGIRRFNEVLAAESRVTATIIQMVGNNMCFGRRQIDEPVATRNF